MSRWLAAVLLAAGWYTCRLYWGMPLNFNRFADLCTLRMATEFREFLTSLGDLEREAVRSLR